MQDIGSFYHLHKEGTLSHSEVVGSADSGKYSVKDGHGHIFSRDKTAYLGHYDTESHLTQIGGFTSHVWSCDQGDSIVCIVQEDIVWDKLFFGEQFFDDRVTTALDFQDAIVVVDGSFISILPADKPEVGEHIDLSYYIDISE